MKKLFFASAAIAACMLVSCKDGGDASANNQKIKDDNAKVYKALETGDVSQIKDIMSDDAVDHGGAPDGSDIKGKDSILAALSRIHTCFEPGLKFNIINQSVDGDYLYALTEMTGKTTANPGMGMPPATEMNMKSVDVVKMKDGKMTDHWAFVNPADMMKMMGAPGDHGPMPPPPAPGDSGKMPMKDTAKKM